jgi:hypothetical protein
MKKPTAIISLHNLNRLVFVVKTHVVSEGEVKMLNDVLFT